MHQMRKQCSKVFSLILTLAMLCTMVSGAALAEEAAAESPSLSTYASMDASQAAGLSNVYEYNLTMGEMSLMLYLNIDEEGNFVFSRSTDFSSDEKGAGVILAGESGDYAMVYRVVNGEAVEEGANVATFELEADGSLQFTSAFWFGATHPTLTDEDGNETYVRFAVSEAEVADEPAIVSGDYVVDNTWSAMVSAYAPVLSVDAEAMTFTLYDSANEEATVSGSIAYEGDGAYTLACADGKRVSFTYADGVITFTTNVAAARAEAGDDLSGAYHVDLSGAVLASAEDLVFEVDGEAMRFQFYEADNAETVLDSGSITLADDVYALVYDDVIAVEGTGTTFVWGGDGIALTSVFTAVIPEVAEGIDDDILFGTYGGKYTYQPGAMPMAIEYYFTLTLNRDGSYRFKSYYVVSDEKYDGYNETGTYTAQSGVLTLTSSAGKVMSGTIDANGKATLTRPLGPGMSGGEGSPFTVTLTYGRVYSPDDDDSADIAYGTYGGTHETVAMGNKLTYAVLLTLNENGTYTYKVSFVVMGNSYTETESGTYVVDGGTMRLTSSAGKVMVGKIDSNGTATITRLVSSFATSAATVKLTLGYKPSVGGSDEDEDDEDETDEYRTGVYTGTYSHKPNGMPMALNYSYSLNLKADGSYSFESSYEVSGTTYPGLAESGTYVVKDGVLTLTASDGYVCTGTIDENGNATLKRALANSMSGEGKGTEYDIALSIHGGEGNGSDETASLESGAYSVDISWSPMGAMISPVLDIDAKNMTFNLYNATAPEASKGAGTISYADGVYTLTYDNGNTTSFAYANGVITFTSKLWYGSASFNNADDDGNFVSYTATASGNGGEGNGGDETTSLESGAYSVDISWSPMGAMISPVLDIDAKNMTFNLYNATAPEASKGAGTISCADGVYTLTYDSGNTTSFTYANGVITFTSKLWYGSASFNNADADGNFVSYTATASGNGDDEQGESKYKTGTYAGQYTYQPGGMPMAIEYSYSLTLNGDGSYSFESSYTVSGTAGEGLSESGTYAVKDGVLTLTASDGYVCTGTIDANGNATLKRALSNAMSGEGKGTEHDITLSIHGGSGSDDEENASKDQLPSGKYVLNESSYSEAATHKMNIILVIDADAKTLHTYSMAGDAKGSGTYTYNPETGVYTVTYTADTQAGVGNTATFVYENNRITFTSPLYYGVAKLNEIDEDGNFMGYTAALDNDVEFEGGGSDDEEEGKDTEGVLQGSATVENTSTLMWNDYGVKVAVSVDDDGKITDVSVVGFTDKADGMNFYSSYANLALDGGLRAQLVGKTKDEVGSMGIDAVSGATCSTNGIFNAVKNALGLSTNSGSTGSTTYKTGTYGGKYTNVSSSGKETQYVYALTLNDNGSYAYTASFAMGGGIYTQTENGSYTVENGKLTLVSSGLVVKDGSGNEAISSGTSVTMTGSIDGDGNATVNRHVSYFAQMSGGTTNLTFTYGKTYSLSETAVIDEAAIATVALDEEPEASVEPEETDEPEASVEPEETEKP
ncbi:MAG: FMN-binding protein [Clostridia bacterium]|nr:FMN-binding protein [Clostridia bacterium]